MATVFQGKPQCVFMAILGKDGAGDYYDIDEDSWCYVGVDGEGTAHRIVPVTAIDTNLPTCKPLHSSADKGANGEMAMVGYPFIIRTDKVADGAVPTDGTLFYVNDDGEASNADGDGSLYALGQTLLVDSTEDLPYLLNVLGPDMQDT